MDASIRTKRDSKLVADEHDAAVLEALHRFGWLPTRDLSAYIWPEHKGTTCAKRALARLRKSGYIAQNTTQSDRAPDGAILSALTESGAAFLRANRGIHAAAGEHLLSKFNATYRHRCLSNEFVIHWLRQNDDPSRAICTEYEITMRRSVLNRKDAAGGDKIADAFIIENAPTWWLDARRREAQRNGWKFCAQRWATWIEVENAYKKGPEQVKLGRELCRLVGSSVLYPTNHGDVVIGLALVLCPDETTERRLAATVLEAAYAPDADHLNATNILDRVRVWRNGGEERTLAAYVRSDLILDARRFKLGAEQIARREKKGR